MSGCRATHCLVIRPPSIDMTYSSCNRLRNGVASQLTRGPYWRGTFCKYVSGFVTAVAVLLAYNHLNTFIRTQQRVPTTLGWWNGTRGTVAYEVCIPAGRECSF